MRRISKFPPTTTRQTHHDEFRPLIAAVIERFGRDDREALMAALRRRVRTIWAWGVRPYHRKIWWEEVRVQLGEPMHPQRRKQLLAAEIARGQKFMFPIED